MVRVVVVVLILTGEKKKAEGRRALSGRGRDRTRRWKLVALGPSHAALLSGPFFVLDSDPRLQDLEIGGDGAEKRDRGGKKRGRDVKKPSRDDWRSAKKETGEKSGFRRLPL